MPGGREVLLQLRQGTGYMDGFWAAAVAGHVEQGESVYDAARREGREEIGVELEEVLPWCAMQRTAATGDPVDERVDYFLTSTSWSGTPRILEPEKCADLRWFNLAALPSPVVAHELRVLDGVRSGHSPPIVVHGF
jgi:8-oxo-dGTP diphosphatase